MAVSVFSTIDEVLTGFGETATRLRAETSGALQKSGLYLEGEMKKAAPYRTGRLRASIANEMLTDFEVEVGVIRPVEGKVLVYAPVQEWGWPERNITGKFYVTGTFDANQAKVSAFIDQALEKALG